MRHKVARTCPLAPRPFVNALREAAQSADRTVELVVAGTAQPEVTEICRRLATESGEPRRFSEAIPRSARPEEVVLVVIDSAEEAGLRRFFQDVSWPGGGVVAVIGAAGERGAAGESCGVSWYSEHVARLGLPAGILDERAFGGLCEVIAWAAGGRMVPLARRVPALREAAARRLLRAVALQNAALGGLVAEAETGRAVLTLNQVRLFLGMAAVYGCSMDGDRLLEIVSTMGAGSGLAALARRLGRLLPGAEWAVSGGVEYLGTRALGGLSLWYLQQRSPLALSSLSEQVGRLVRRLGP